MMMMISESLLFPPPLISPEPLMCRGIPLVLSDLPATFGQQLVNMEFEKNGAFGFSYLYRLQNANMLLLRRLQQCYDYIVDIIQARQNDGQNGI